MTVGFIQARLGSSRFPNKVIRSLWGQPIIRWVARAAENASSLDRIVLLTLKDDLPAILSHMGRVRKPFRGFGWEGEPDICAQTVQAIENMGLADDNLVVRIFADNPLIFPEEIDHAVSQFLLKDIFENPVTWRVSESSFFQVCRVRTIRQISECTNSEHTDNASRAIITEHLFPDEWSRKERPFFTVDYEQDIERLESFLARHGGAWAD